jgi:hypothetical protein
MYTLYQQLREGYAIKEPVINTNIVILGDKYPVRSNIWVSIGNGKDIPVTGHGGP